MSTLADRLRQIMAQNGLKAADIARATKIQAGVLSRYLSGQVIPSAKNLITLSQYLDVTPDWLLNTPDAPKPPQIVRGTKQTDKDKIIELQERLIEDKDKQIVWLSKSCDALADEVRRWEEWKAGNKARHAKEQEKAYNAIMQNKQKG